MSNDKSHGWKTLQESINYPSVNKKETLHVKPLP